jgi:hypothetical protein
VRNIELHDALAAGQPVARAAAVDCSVGTHSTAGVAKTNFARRPRRMAGALG